MKNQMIGRGDRRYPIPKTLEKLKEINRQVSSDLGVELDDILHVSRTAVRTKNRGIKKQHVIVVF
ncbi:hypothetical protein BBD40_12640 [Paenibacillus ihbetae]|uniref:Uncharacterized protein n=1 Tax=Paenibacillus ihbetae TaxID=1870820 RepID=A0ABX3JYS2_9BACL|nr:hypothetical protein BBD40_12640 [Paenibacillus ihbetae]